MFWDVWSCFETFESRWSQNGPKPPLWLWRFELVWPPIFLIKDRSWSAITASTPMPIEAKMRKREVAPSRPLIIEDEQYVPSRWLGWDDKESLCIYLIPAFPLIFSNNRWFFIDRECFFSLLLYTEQGRFFFYGILTRKSEEEWIWPALEG